MRVGLDPEGKDELRGGAVPAHKPRSQPAYPHSISRPLVPTFTLCTPGPDNLLHPEWFQSWNPGVLILH